MARTHAEKRLADYRRNGIGDWSTLTDDDILVVDETVSAIERRFPDSPTRSLIHDMWFTVWDEIQSQILAMDPPMLDVEVRDPIDEFPGTQRAIEESEKMQNNKNHIDVPHAKSPTGPPEKTSSKSKKSRRDSRGSSTGKGNAIAEHPGSRNRNSILRSQINTPTKTSFVVPHAKSPAGPPKKTSSKSNKSRRDSSGSSTGKGNAIAEHPGSRNRNSFWSSEIETKSNWKGTPNKLRSTRNTCNTSTTKNRRKSPCRNSTKKIVRRKSPPEYEIWDSETAPEISKIAKRKNIVVLTQSRATKTQKTAAENDRRLDITCETVDSEEDDKTLALTSSENDSGVVVENNQEHVDRNEWANAAKSHDN